MVFVVGYVLEKDQRADQRNGLGRDIVFRCQHGQSRVPLLTFIDIFDHNFLLDGELLQIVLPLTLHLVPPDLPDNFLDIFLRTKTTVF